jgi:hypothetical protein
MRLFLRQSPIPAVRCGQQHAESGKPDHNRQLPYQRGGRERVEGYEASGIAMAVIAVSEPIGFSFIALKPSAIQPGRSP